jgi:hypothetical protein
MPQFAYRARNPQGGLVEGVLDCADRAVAIRQIELQECIPVRIDLVGAEVKTKAAEAAVPASSTQNLKIPHGQLLIFTEQLAHLLQAGMTLDEALSILQKRLKQPRVQQMTRSLHQALVDGRSFSQALNEMPRIFAPLYVNLVATGLDLSGFSRTGWRHSRHNLYHIHGAAVEQFHGANWRRASIAHTDSAANSSCDHWLLVGRRAGGGRFNCWFPRPCPQ